MKIVQGDELQWVRGLEYRGGTVLNPGAVDYTRPPKERS